jgi:hypothetical protein
VREALGIPDGVPLAAVYLNPHFKDPSIAAAVERFTVRAACAGSLPGPSPSPRQPPRPSLGSGEVQSEPRDASPA